MNYRILGKTGFKVSEISLGTWQLGSKWGEPFDADKAWKTLEAACEQGINLFDTADIYQDGKKEKIYVVTKCGRKLNPHVASGYNARNIRQFIHDSLQNLQREQLDLVLLHCPPSEVYQKQEVFDELNRLKQEGLIAHYGVSVERISEALEALKQDISAIEIIFNMFRLRRGRAVRPGTAETGRNYNQSPACQRITDREIYGEHFIRCSWPPLL